MANNPTNDLIVEKLVQRYTSIPKDFGDLWASYCAETNGGSVAAGGVIITPGVYWANDALYNHYGGPETSFADRANRFWTNWVPAVGG